MVYEDDGLASWHTYTLTKSLANSLADSSCRVPHHCVYRCFPAFLSFSCSSWGLLVAWTITSQDCIAEKPTRGGPARRHFFKNIDQNAILNGKNNGTAYANPELGLGIQWKILARQKAGIGLHSHPIVWGSSTTKSRERLRQKNVSGKMKQNGTRDRR